jgi:hypothetical protein
VIPLGSPVGFTEVRAQHLALSLDDISDLYPETPTDTLKRDQLERLTIGEHCTVPNFLVWDFRRERVVEEYSLYAPLKVTFRHPNLAYFEFEETRDGSFIVLTPRDLSAPGLSIEVESVDEIAERLREESFDEVWRETVVTSINSQTETESGRKGLLNISIPVPLPSAVERIIGSGEATNIDISGRESITFAGESRRISPFIGVEGQTKQPLFPSLDLRQELDVRLNGQIGEKINIQVDHSSSSILTEDNRIRLSYTGFEDDIVQLIEMGNTSLSLPGSQLVSFSANAQGLFGIKALAQVGPNKITMIASKEEGELSRASFTPRGGQIGQEEVRTINDADYIKNTYFFLDRPPDDSTNFFFRPNEGAIQLFESVEPFEIAADPTLVTFFGRAWVDSLGDGADIRDALNLLAAGQTPSPFQERQYRLLGIGEDYQFVRDAADDSVVGIELTRAVSDTRVLAVRYVNEVGDTIGNYDDFADTLALELIKPHGARPDNEFGYTWSFMMRHIYSLQLSNIDPSSMTLEIHDFRPRLDRSIPEGSTIPWIRIFGLDQTNLTGTGLPDARVDVTRNLIDFSRGILTFPTTVFRDDRTPLVNLTPFNPSDEVVAEFTDSLFEFTGIYEGFRRPEIYTEFLNDILSAPKFQIVVRAASTTRSFNINAFNITSGSETVRLDGRELVRNRDYKINYETGEVELQGTVLDELTPSSNITVDYEFKPFIGGGSSSLVGFNNLLTLSENATFGTTWLYESKSTSSIRPRLGEEPTRAVVGNVNTSLQYNPYFLTSLVNKLPLVNTDARSSLSLIGEVAVSFPDPNTLGEVYIDDFEGVEDSDLIALARRSWHPPSPPVDSTGLSTREPSTRMRTMWYNIEPELNGQKSGVTRRDLNPNLDERESTLVQTLDIEFDTLTTDTTHWGGVMAGFRGGGLDLSQGQFIEFWINDFRGDNFLARGGKIHIDLGSIDEDFYRPELSEFDTEDPNRDGFVALTEDTGLDRIAAGEPGDSPDDDWSISRLPQGDPNGRFLQINGTEGNRVFDSEDLDGSGQMETTNAYFSFVLDLATEAGGPQPVVDVRKQFPGHVRLKEPPHANDSWRLYRIRLGDNVERSPLGFKPSFEQIRHIRIWVEDVRRVVDPQIKRVQITELKVVGNRWERDGVRTLSDSLLTATDTQGAEFSLGVISTKTDPITYIPPRRPNEENDIAEKEQSLLVAYDSLQAGQSFRLRKRFAGQGLDFTSYRDIHAFVHTDHLDPSMEYFFQIAIDSLNYYELSMPFTAGFFPANNWSHVAIKLTDLTQLKFEPADSTVSGQVRDFVDENRVYNVRMVGNPSLFRVRFLYAGVRNKGSVQASGDLWLNDIFLGDRRRDVDFAQRVAGSVNMANVISFSGSFGRIGPDFRGLRQTRGSGSDQRNMAFSVKTSLGHFIPLMGFSIPVTANYSRNTLLPKFTPNSDTEVRDEAIQDSLKTESISRGFSTTLTRSGSKNPLLRYTFDKLKANFSMSDARTRTPSSADTSVSMSGTLDYSITWGPRRSLNLFKGIRFRYWLNSLNFRVNATRQTGRRYRNVGGVFRRDPSFYSAKVTTSGQANYVPFQSLNTSFRMNVARDYARPHQRFGIDIGTETNRSHSFQLNYKPPRLWLIGAFQPDFNFNAGYREDSSPNVRLAGDPLGVRNVSNTRDASVKLSFDLGKYFKRIFAGLNLAEKEPQPPVPEQQPTGQAVPDTTAAEDQNEEEKTDKWVAFRKLGGVFSRIRKINASFNQRFASNYTRVPGRPGFFYQLGITDDSGVSRRDASGVDVGLNTPERVNESNSIVLDSGVQITTHIDLSARFGTTLSRNSFRTSESNAASTTWPDINISWTGLERYGPLRGAFTTTAATVGYRTTTRKAGVGKGVDTKDVSTAITPTIVFTWKNGINTNLNMQLSKTTNELRGSLNETNSMSINMELKYAFAAGKALRIPLPFLRNRALRSNLNTSLGIGYTRTGGKRSQLGSEFFQSVPKRTSFRVAPRVTYNFTQALNGGFFIDFQRSFSEATDQTTTVTRVGLDATFTF